MKIDKYLSTFGTIIMQKIKCGKDNCKCKNGSLHGPYAYRCYRSYENGKWVQRKEYIKPKEIHNLQSIIEIEQGARKVQSEFHQQAVLISNQFNEARRFFVSR
jgi:hypothetical protein